MRRSGGSKDKLRSSVDRVGRCPAAYNELIGRCGVKGTLGATVGFDRRPRGGGRSRAAAGRDRRIPLRLAAAATRRLRPHRATACCVDSHGASQHGHGDAQETQPNRHNGCQPTHHPFRPPRSSCVGAVPSPHQSYSIIAQTPQVSPEVPFDSNAWPQWAASSTCHSKLGEPQYACKPPQSAVEGGTPLETCTAEHGCNTSQRRCRHSLTVRKDKNGSEHGQKYPS